MFYTMKNEDVSYLILVMTLVFGVVFYDVLNIFFHFSYTDEIIALLLFSFWILKGKKKKEFFIFWGIAIFFLAYSLIFPNNVKNAIITDFFIQVKPFVAFYTTYCLSFRFTAFQRKSLCKLCLLLTIVLIPVGFLGIGGRGIMNVFGGHSRFATMCSAIAMTYLFFSTDSRRSRIISLLMLSLGLLSLRSKIFGFFTTFVIVVFWGESILRHLKLVSLKTIIFFFVLLGAGLVAAWEKIEFYFITGFSGSTLEHTFARPLLYVKAFEILCDNPLFGTGFGSYATHASSLYYSPLYAKYYMIYNYDIGHGKYISDTFFPSLVQFGGVGIYLFFLFWKRRIQEGIYIASQEKTVFSLKMVLLIVVFFLIESVADSTFTHNRGMYMMMLLAVVLRNPITKR